MYHVKRSRVEPGTQPTDKNSRLTTPPSDRDLVEQPLTFTLQLMLETTCHPDKVIDGCRKNYL